MLRDPPATGGIELFLPANLNLLALARVQAGAVGALLDLTVDEVDDLRLAVEELCLWTVGRCQNPPGRLGVVFSWDEEFLGVSVHCEGGDGGRATSDTEEDAIPDDLSSRVLDALVDEHGTEEGPRPRAWLRKKRIAK